jgi:pseudouridine synthase
MTNPETMRINRYLARCGVASRRKSDDIISAGRVTLNGKVAQLSDAVDPQKDSVTVDGKPIHLEQKQTTLILYKPRSVLSAMSDDRGRKTVADFLPKITGLAPAGRLDYDVSGIMLFSTDGELIQKVTHPSFQVTKVYTAEVLREVTLEDIFALQKGFTIDGHFCTAHSAKILSIDDRISTISITMTEGRKREVKLLCEAIGHAVVSLKRVEFAGLSLAGLHAGKHRILSDKEYEILKAL